MTYYFFAYKPGRTILSDARYKSRKSAEQALVKRGWTGWAHVIEVNMPFRIKVMGG
jgi:hypothetical protein